MPCTTILVGKAASLDGSVIIARNEDSGSGEYNPKRMCVVHPEDQPRVYKSVLSHVTIELPDNPMRYTAMPEAVEGHGIWAAAGVNEANVAMTATETITSNERVLGADPLVEYVKAKGKEGEPGFVPEKIGGIGEEDMVTLVLPYIHSAREGVLRLGNLLETYGTYEMNGIAFADTDEIWWLETVGGHHWIARRVPDECYVTMPNQLGIDVFDLTDAEGDQQEFMCSADLREFIEKYRLDWLEDASYDPEEEDEDWDGHIIFNPREAFGSHSDADHVYNTPRAWAMHRFLNPQLLWDEPGEAWGPEDDDLPWCLEPLRPISIEDVKYVLSLHFQGTDYDPYNQHADPTRRGMYRPIGINRNGELAVLQLRPWAPEATRAIQWIAYGSNVFNALVPLYANVDSVPEYVANTTERVTSESFYWANRIVAALADAHWGSCANHIERYQELVGAKGREALYKADADIEKRGLSYKDAAAELAKVNEDIVAMVRTQTEDVLNNVLFSASNEMHNGFARSDA